MEWIDVKNRLPPNNTECVVWCKAEKEKNSCFRLLSFNSTYFGETDNRFVLYENGGEYYHDFTDEVTHWMIPKKPN